MDAAAAPHHAAAALYAAVQELVDRAIASVMPGHDRLLQMPKERVRQSVRPHRGDLTCHAVITLFRKCAAGRPAITIRTVSDMGLERERMFDSVVALGEAVLHALGDVVTAGGLRQRDVLADARVAVSGELQFCTQLRMEEQRLAGQLLCGLCGGFFAAGRGLRDHQQVLHGRAYEVARAAVDNAERAILPVQQALSGLLRVHPDMAALLARWRAAAEARVAAKGALSPALAAARDGDLAALQALAAAGACDPLTEMDRHTSSLMHWAAGSGHLHICQWLAGLAPALAHTAQRLDGRTPLHWAARNGHLPVVCWLVRNCAVDINAATLDGTCALHWACWQGHLDVCHWLVDEGACNLHQLNSYGCNAIQWAALLGSVPLCTWLRDKGLDIGLLNHNGHSAVHKAALHGHEQVCRWLLAPRVADAADADADAGSLAAGGGLGLPHLGRDHDGNTPADMARGEGFTALAAWLDSEARRMIENV